MSANELDHEWKEGDTLRFWAGREHGWVEAKVLSVSVRGVPTIIDPVTGRKRVMHPRSR